MKGERSVMELVKSDELMKESVLLKRVEWWKRVDDGRPNSKFVFQH